MPLHHLPLLLLFLLPGCDASVTGGLAPDAVRLLGLRAGLLGGEAGPGARLLPPA